MGDITINFTDGTTGHYIDVFGCLILSDVTIYQKSANTKKTIKTHFKTESIKSITYNNNN